MSFAVATEYILNAQPEKLRDFEREGQARNVLFGFNRIDRLTRHFKFHSELRLRPALLRAQRLYAVFQPYRRAR